MWNGCSWKIMLLWEFYPMSGQIRMGGGKERQLLVFVGPKFDSLIFFCFQATNLLQQRISPAAAVPGQWPTFPAHVQSRLESRARSWHVPRTQWAPDAPRFSWAPSLWRSPRARNAAEPPHAGRSPGIHGPTEPDWNAHAGAAGWATPHPAGDGRILQFPWSAGTHGEHAKGQSLPPGATVPADAWGVWAHAEPGWLLRQLLFPPSCTQLPVSQ